MEENTSVNTTVPAEVQEEVTPTLTPAEDLEARFQELEDQKNKAIEEAANWKVAALKAKKKDDPVEEESEDEKMRRIAREELKGSQVVEIVREQDALIQKAFKENKELKLAYTNKSSATPPAAMGSHSENTPVRDTMVTPEMMTAFKARGWTDKDIERFKKNYNRYAR